MSDPTVVEAPEAGKRTSKIVGPMSSQDTVQLEAENASCFWNDQEFPKGAQVRNDGKCHECSFGLWVEISEA